MGKARHHDEGFSRVIRADDGAELYIEARGTGGGMVLAHGGPGLWDYLGDLAALLEPDATVARYDQRGGGRSSQVGPFTIDRFVADYETVRRAAGFDRIIAAGHSWGASLSLLYAARHPDRVRGVLYISGVGLEWARFKPIHREETTRRLGNQAPRFFELAALRAPTLEQEHECNRLRWGVEYADEDTARAGVERMLASGFRVNVECNGAISTELLSRTLDDWAREIGDLDVPVLIISGDQDPRPSEATDGLVARLQTASRTVLRGAGHFPWIERKAEFIDTVSTWMKSLPT